MSRMLLPLLAALVGCGLLGPSFEAKDGKLEPPGLFAAGAKASCAVKNLSDAAAPATVGFTLTLADGTTVSGDEYVMLNPKEQQDVTHEFKGVRVPDRDGARVACTATAAR